MIVSKVVIIVVACHWVPMSPVTKYSLSTCHKVFAKVQISAIVINWQVDFTWEIDHPASSLIHINRFLKTFYSVYMAIFAENQSGHWQKINYNIVILPKTWHGPKVRLDQRCQSSKPLHVQLYVFCTIYVNMNKDVLKIIILAASREIFIQGYITASNYELTFG